MTYAIRARQARCCALGAPCAVDGVDGPITRMAVAKAKTLQAARGLPFVHPSGLTRIHVHWTAGGPTASREDREHYHVLVEQDGTVFRPWLETAKLAHTLNANGGAIGVSACGMAGATERPWSPGKHPVTAAQMQALARVVADLSAIYDIPVSRWSILTHAEVQPTLGIKQRGKIDYIWLPGMTAPADPVEVGDRFRDLVR